MRQKEHGPDGGSEEELFFRLFCISVRQMLQKSGVIPAHLQEVRLRIGRPLLLYGNGREYGVTMDGRLTECIGDAYRITKEDLRQTLESISGYSLYVFDEEMKQGFLTVPGGHRVGLAGKIVSDERGIQCIRHISCLNIRFSHERIGCADSVLPYVADGTELFHTLILSPPGCGKTTLLRDLIRQISNGADNRAGRTVGVVDERSEIAGSWHGIPQNDVGSRTDVLDCCPKAEGMMMLLRAMAPQVIAVDELGGSKDAEAVENVFRCGCCLLATAHGSSLEDIRRRPQLRPFVEQEMFGRYIVLHAGACRRVTEIFDAKGMRLFREEFPCG